MELVLMEQFSRHPNDEISYPVQSPHSKVVLHADGWVQGQEQDLMTVDLELNVNYFQ